MSSINVSIILRSFGLLALQTNLISIKIKWLLQRSFTMLAQLAQIGWFYKYSRFFLLLSNVLLLLKFKLPPFFHLHASHIPIFCWTLLTTSLLRHMCGRVFLYHLWAIFTSTLSPSPFFTPKIYAQPMNTITVQQRCVCVVVYFAYSSLFLLLSLCHNVSCVLLLPMPKEHRLYTVLLLPTL